MTDLGAHLAGIFPPRHPEAPDHVVGQPGVDGLRHHEAGGRGGERGGGLRPAIATESLTVLKLHLRLEQIGYEAMITHCYWSHLHVPPVVGLAVHHGLGQGVLVS